MSFAEAKAAVAAWLSSLGVHIERIPTPELEASYPLRGVASGWRLTVQFSDQVRRLDLLLPLGFPWQPPRVALVDRPPFLTWPHVEKDGLLCLATNTFEIDPDQPVRAVAYVLKEAEEAVNFFVAGAYDGDFRDEFATYWDWSSAPGARVISLLQPVPPTRAVRLWCGKHSYLVAETDNELRRWLANSSGMTPESVNVKPAAFLWLKAPPVPRDYPATTAGLRALFPRPDTAATELLTQLASERPDKIFAALGIETKNGPAIGSMIIPAPKPTKHGARDPLTKGFRPGTVPAAILLARYSAGTALTRRPVERADATWIHGRGQDPRAQRLRSMAVVVAGCGSVGASVAVALAQAGVGLIILIDFDVLTWANIGRHPLGAYYVNANKAKGLAEKLRVDFPHATIEPYDMDVDTAIRKHPDLLAGADLIVAATGSWAAESRLDSWHAANGHAVPVLYSWMEPHACAGHAVLLAGVDACLRCGFDGTGLPTFRMTEWTRGAPSMQEPACGAAFQPYGPVELGYVNSLVAEAALDGLLNKQGALTYRVWAGSGKRLRHLGGSWTKDWEADAQFRETGGVIAERAWPRASCARCAKSQAA